MNFAVYIHVKHTKKHIEHFHFLQNIPLGPFSVILVLLQ